MNEFPIRGVWFGVFFKYLFILFKIINNQKASTTQKYDIISTVKICH